MAVIKLLHPHHLLGQSGAQTKRESVLIGSQLIGTAQIKHIKTPHGSHISPRNEVTFMDPHKGVHGDENNVCS